MAHGRSPGYPWFWVLDLNLSGNLNAYVTAIVSITVIVIGNLVIKGEPGLFKSTSFQRSADFAGQRAP